MNTNISRSKTVLGLLIIGLFCLPGIDFAQSTDIDAPTPLTSNVIEGEGDGKAETFYYSLMATKGDLKVTLDAKSDNYSVIMDAALLTEDGKELLMVSVVANDSGKRGVGNKHFVRDQKVILRVRLPKDEHLKLLTYKLKLDGAIRIDPPTVASESIQVETARTLVTVIAKDSAWQLHRQRQIQREIS